MFISSCERVRLYILLVSLFKEAIVFYNFYLLPCIGLKETTYFDLKIRTLIDRW